MDYKPLFLLKTNMKFFQTLMLFCICYSSLQGKPEKTRSVAFIITVNNSWKYDLPVPNNTCMATIKTDFITPDTPKNKSENIQVGDCDHGPLVYTVKEDGYTHSSINLTFYSSVIDDASPPTCNIDWNYQFKVPTHYIGKVDTYIEVTESLLPGCATADSREGYHMTYYWFSIFDWSLASIGDDTSFTPMHPAKPLDIAWVSFLVAVNVTGNLCKATATSPPMKPNVNCDDNPLIKVSNCETGAQVNFTINSRKQSNGAHTYVDLSYYSSTYPDDNTPLNCSIMWDYAYRNPTEQDRDRSPLPGCYISFNSGGPYTVYFWIYIYDWAYSG